MKKILFLLVTFFILFHGSAWAKKSPEAEPPGPKASREDDMLNKADEMSYSGQIDTAAKMMGKEAPSVAMKDDDGPWGMTAMMLGMIWGSIGTGYFLYGKKQARFVFLLCGIALCVFPMIVSDNTLNLVLGLVLTITPFKVEI
ncbi:MAG: hypothetical protein WA705_26185 [Candidatus Ozemobacteraceae bacterium]